MGGKPEVLEVTVLEIRAFALALALALAHGLGGRAGGDKPLSSPGLGPGGNSGPLAAHTHRRAPANLKRERRERLSPRPGQMQTNAGAVGRFNGG